MQARSVHNDRTDYYKEVRSLRYERAKHLPNDHAVRMFEERALEQRNMNTGTENWPTLS